jgi:hypothetical protein
MNILEKINSFKSQQPEISEDKINSLVTAVAKYCMQAIVIEQEKNSKVEKAWDTIDDEFNIVITDKKLLLPLKRHPDIVIDNKFNKACIEENIEGIKEGLRHFVHINYNHETDHDEFIEDDTSVLTDMAMIGNLNTLKFFIEDDFINNHQFYRQQVNFQEVKGKLFRMAYHYSQTEVIQYLIIEHDAEFTPEAQESMKLEYNDDLEFRKEVLRIIENKHLNYILELKLDNKNSNKTRYKI